MKNEVSWEYNTKHVKKCSKKLPRNLIRSGKKSVSCDHLGVSTSLRKIHYFRD